MHEINKEFRLIRTPVHRLHVMYVLKAKKYTCFTVLVLPITFVLSPLELCIQMRFLLLGETFVQSVWFI